MNEDNPWFDYCNENLDNGHPENNLYKGRYFITFEKIPCSINTILDEFVIVDFGSTTIRIPKDLIPNSLLYQDANLIYFKRIYENGNLIRGFTYPPVDIEELKELYLSD
jgi:hypothetical protein